MYLNGWDRDINIRAGICAAFKGINSTSDTHSHSPCSAPLSSWSAVGYWTSSQNKHNLQRNSKKEKEEQKEKQSGEWKEKDKEVSVSNVRSVKRSGQFPIGPHNDSLISQEESAAETYTKCWFNPIRLISYTAVAVVVGKSDRMRCWRANAHSHINNKTGSPTLPFK